MINNLVNMRAGLDETLTVHDAILSDITLVTFGQYGGQTPLVSH
jgi:hypothetical protein